MMKSNSVVVVALLIGLLFSPVELVKAQDTQETSAQFSDASHVVILEPGTSASRYFGDLLIKYSIDSTGKHINCTLFLSTQFVGVYTLIKEQTNYEFDVQLASYKAKGTLTLTLGVFPQVSRLSGNFTYSVVANNESFTFIGDLVGWYIKP